MIYISKGPLEGRPTVLRLSSYPEKVCSIVGVAILLVVIVYINNTILES